ncbi:MAG: hypothetical protein ACE5G1_10450, partial [bacterium]
MLWVDGNRIWAFGHTFFLAGASRLPFRHVSVADTIQSSVFSFKLVGCDLGTSGTITLDGLTEIGGVIGKEAPA